MAYKIAFSGHRPNKLGGWNWDAPFNVKIREYFKVLLADIIQNTTEDRLEFYSGMALGFDIFMADVVIELKEIYPNISLVAAIPFLKQSAIWPTHSVDRYENLLTKCDKAVMVDELEVYRIPGIPVGEYHAAKLKNRNDFMAEVMDSAIVLWDGSQGGTFDFVCRARDKGKEMTIIKPINI